MTFRLWETLKESIIQCTGFVTYYVSGLFGRPDHLPPRPRNLEEKQPLPPPPQLGEVTEEELKQYDGSDAKKPLLMAIKGHIYDVSQSRLFYGPGGPYALFAGKDASRALAKMSYEEKDLTGDISGLGSSELEVLQDWENKFMRSYVKVGTIKKDVPVTEGTSNVEAVETKEVDVVKPAEAAETSTTVETKEE